MSLAKELAKLKAALDAPWPEETWKAKAEIAERELSATKDEYCKTAFALTEYTGRAEKAEAEVARLKEELQLARLAPSPEEAPPKIQVIREKMSPEKAEEVRKIRLLIGEDELEKIANTPEPTPEWRIRAEGKRIEPLEKELDYLTREASRAADIHNHVVIVDCLRYLRDEIEQLKKNQK